MEVSAPLPVPFAEDETRAIDECPQGASEECAGGIGNIISELDQMTSVAAARDEFDLDAASVKFIDTIKSLLNACCEDVPRKLPWCSIPLGDCIHPCIASEKCVAIVMAAAKLMRGNVDFQHHVLGLICYTFQLTKVRSQYNLETIGKHWLSYNVCEVLSDLQEASCPVQTRKLAWDIAYILVNCVLKPQHPSMGFELDTSSPKQLLSELSAIHILIYLSCEQDAKCVPVLLKHAVFASSVWASSNRSCSPLVVQSHTRTVISADEDAIRRPSGLKEQLLTKFS
jgi:hypothetical protein